MKKSLLVLMALTLSLGVFAADTNKHQQEQTQTNVEKSVPTTDTDHNPKNNEERAEDFAARMERFHTTEKNIEK